MKILSLVFVIVFFKTYIFAQLPVIEKDLNPSGASSSRLFTKYKDGFVFVTTTNTNQETLYYYENGIYNIIYQGVPLFSAGYRLINDNVFVKFNGSGPTLKIINIESKLITDIYDVSTYLENIIQVGNFLYIHSDAVYDYQFLYKIDLQTNVKTKVTPLYFQVLTCTYNFRRSTKKIATIIGDYYIYAGRLQGGTISGQPNFELQKVNIHTGVKENIKDIYPGITSSEIEDFYQIGKKLFFTATNGINGRELWVSDGESANTFMLKDITLGSSGTTFVSFEIKNEFLYFVAFSSISNSYQLWKSDGTILGTQLITELDEKFERFMFYKDKLYLFSTVNYNKLWEIDLPSNSKKLIDQFYIDLNNNRNDPYLLGNILVFFGENLGDIPRGTLRCINLDTKSSYWLDSDQNRTHFFAEIRNIYQDGGLLYFNGLNSPKSNGNGRSLWYTNGTFSGTRRISVNESNLINPYNFFRFQDNLFFTGYLEPNGVDFCKINGKICENTNEITGTIQDSLNFRSSNFIGSKNIILENAKVTFDATNSVVLNPGFEVNSGAIFKSQIQGCVTEKWETTLFSGNGYSSYRNFSLSLIGFGEENNLVTDQGVFYNNSSSGDLELVSKLSVSQRYNSDYNFSGLMIRESNQPDAPFYALILDKTFNLKIQKRRIAGNAKNEYSSILVQNDVWLKIEKRGNIFKSYYKLNQLDGWIPVIDNDSTNDIGFKNNVFKIGFSSLTNRSDDCIFSKILINGRTID